MHGDAGASQYLFCKAVIIMMKGLGASEGYGIGRVMLIGSDAHNLDTRPPEYEAGVNALTKKYGQDAIDVSMQNANNLVK